MGFQNKSIYVNIKYYISTSLKHNYIGQIILFNIKIIM